MEGATTMSVRLIAISKPCVDECATAQDLVTYCGRVSNPANQANTDTAPRLVAYLAKHAHWSPFEMVSLTVEIRTTRAIARQILRHRSFSFQEFSQRYAAVLADPVLCEARTQDAKNRQASHAVDDAGLQEWWEYQQIAVAATAAGAYKDALERGIAKEVARVVLPEGLTESVLYMAGTLRSFVHYCQLRCGNGTQKEHREIAAAVRDIVVEQFPTLTEVMNDE
jgi:thymidylate synthase (FAD)